MWRCYLFSAWVPVESHGIGCIKTMWLWFYQAHFLPPAFVFWFCQTAKDNIGQVGMMWGGVIHDCNLVRIVMRVYCFIENFSNFLDCILAFLVLWNDAQEWIRLVGLGYYGHAICWMDEIFVLVILNNHIMDTMVVIEMVVTALHCLSPKTVSSSQWSEEPLYIFLSMWLYGLLTPTGRGSDKWKLLCPSCQPMAYLTNIWSELGVDPYTLDGHSWLEWLERRSHDHPVVPWLERKWRYHPPHIHESHVWFYHILGLVVMMGQNTCWQSPEKPMARIQAIYLLSRNCLERTS